MIDRRGFLLALLATPVAGAAFGGSPGGSPWLFASIDGGTLDLAEFRGGPVLVVNTASRCGFTRQYDGIQALWDRYRTRGLTVVGVPSQSFGQELETAGAVKDFCEVNFALDFPMTGLVEVAGPEAHPFYQWAAAQGQVPSWNFHKILLDGDGRLAAGFDRHTEPDDPRFVAAVEALLPERADP